MINLPLVYLYTTIPCLAFPKRESRLVRLGSVQRLHLCPAVPCGAIYRAVLLHYAIVFNQLLTVYYIPI